MVDSKKDGALLSLTSGWLEKDVTQYFRPTPEQIAAAQRPAVFIAILVWKKEKYIGGISARLEESLGSQGPPGIKLSVSRTATELIQELPGDAPTMRSSRPLATSLASLLQDCPPRSYHEDHGEGNLYPGLSDSTWYRDVQYGKRKFPGPTGYFVPQAELCRGWERFYPLKKQPLLPQHHTDEVYEIVWLRFRPFIFWGQPIHDQPPTVIHQFILRLKQWQRFQEVFWGKDVEDLNSGAIILGE